MLRLEVRLKEKSDWVKVFDPRDSTLFVATDNPPSVGQQVRVDLTIGEGGPKVILRGQVIKRRVQGDASLPKGISVALGTDEREKVNYLNGFVRGGLLNLREKRRIPIRLPVTYGGVNGPCQSFTRDINEEGVFVIANDPLPEESEIHLLITFPSRTAPVSVMGTVSHTVVIEDEDIPGMGIRLKLASGQADDFTRVIDELESKFMSGSLPDELLM